MNKISVHLSLTLLPKPTVSQQSVSPLLKMPQVTRLYAQGMLAFLAKVTWTREEFAFLKISS